MSDNMHRDGIEKIKNYVTRHDEMLIFWVVVMIEIIFGIILIKIYGNTLFNEDSVSYLYNARNVTDNGIYYGLSALVGTWLPLYQMLLIPLVLIDKFYLTGFAGTIISALMTGGICVFLYRFVGRKGSKIAILAPVLFITNIYSLVFGAITMSEQMAVFFLMLIAYFLKSYLDSGETKEFIKCSVALILGSLVRYEIWFIAVFVVVVFLINDIIKNRNGHKIGFAHISLWGIFAWLFTNLIIHRDPFWFENNPLSAKVQGQIFPQYFDGSIYLTVKHAFIQMNMTFGILLYIAAISIIFMITSKKIKELVPIVIFFIPAAVNTVLMYFGQSIGWQRYFYTAMPGIVILTTILLQNIFQIVGQNNATFSKINKTYLTRFGHINSVHVLASTIFITIIIGITLAVAATSFQVDTNGKIEKNEFISNEKLFPKIVDTGKVFENNLDFGFFDKSNYNGYDKIKKLIGTDKILMPAFGRVYRGDHIQMFSSDVLSVSQGISPEQIIDGFDYLEYEQAMKEPWNYTKFVFMPSKEYDYIQIGNVWYKGSFYPYNYYYNDAWHSEFLNRYERVFENEDFELFKLK